MESGAKDKPELCFRLSRVSSSLDHFIFLKIKLKIVKMIPQSDFGRHLFVVRLMLTYILYMNLSVYPKNIVYRYIAIQQWASKLFLSNRQPVCMATDG